MINRLKEICLKIVGSWYNDKEQIIMEFDFNDTLMEESEMYLKIGNLPKVKRRYGVAVLPTSDADGNYQYYFDILHPVKNLYFLISHIDRDTLILKNMDSPFGDIIEQEIKLFRKYQSAEDILKSLD